MSFHALAAHFAVFLLLIAVLMFLLLIFKRHRKVLFITTVIAWVSSLITLGTFISGVVLGHKIGFPNSGHSLWGSLLLISGIVFAIALTVMQNVLQKDLPVSQSAQGIPVKNEHQLQLSHFGVAARNIAVVFVFVIIVLTALVIYSGIQAAS